MIIEKIPNGNVLLKDGSGNILNSLEPAMSVLIDETNALFIIITDDSEGNQTTDVSIQFNLVTATVLNGVSTPFTGNRNDLMALLSTSFFYSSQNSSASSSNQTNGLQQTQIVGTASTLNVTTTPLNAGATYTGTSELSKEPDVLVSCKTDQAGKLYFDFSNDNINWDTFPPNGFDVSAGIHELHNAVKGLRYFRVRFINTSVSNQTYLRIYTYYGVYKQLNAPLNSTVTSDADSAITRSVLMGQTDGGTFEFVPVTNEGHLEVALHEPLLPFGSVHVENLTPIFQTDSVYGINSGQTQDPTVSGSGTVVGTNNMFQCSTGATIYSQAVLQGRKRLRYRAGQGIVGRFAGLYTTPVANSYQIAGFGTPSDGVYFGYGDTNDLSNTSFGVLYVRGGVREVKTLTLTTRATVASNVTVTLNGVATVVALTNSTLQQNVYELSRATYAGWDAQPSGATVVFIRNAAGTTAGTQTYAAGTTGSAATIVQTLAGAASVDTFISQSDWNGDKLDGTGGSGVIADWTKGNVFQVGIQYLGFGTITFKVETTSENNNPIWVTVHTLRLPNTLTQPSFTNPSFPFTMAAYSAGSTTNLTVKVGSFAGFIEGQKMLQGNRFSYINVLTTVSATNFQALMTVMNSRYYQGKASQVVINLLSVSGAIKHTSPVIYYLIKGGTLIGSPNFQPLSSNSSSLWDTAATTVTYTIGDQLLWTGHVGDTGEIDHHFGNGSYNAEELTLQPGEWVTLAAKSSTGNVAYVSGSINTREDQ